jgi:hypothetical protein
VKRPLIAHDVLLARCVVLTLGDYERAYLWTGLIDDTLYCEDCTFTDPTLSFKGLSTFKRNVASLRPLAIKLVPVYGVDLLDCTLYKVHLSVN